MIRVRILLGIACILLVFVVRELSYIADRMDELTEVLR